MSMDDIYNHTARLLKDYSECIERLAEFASEMASDREAFSEGMKANCKTAMEFLNQLETEQAMREDYKETCCDLDDSLRTVSDRSVALANEVEMWRGLCHARAVQLNEAYNEIAKLRTEVDELHQMIDDIDDEE